MTRTRIGLLLLAELVTSCGSNTNRSGPERQFQESLTNATLVGNFSTDGRSGLGEDKYTIEKVTKLAGDTWLFHARVQYGGRDVTVPMPLTVKWAGDTPMVSLTDLTIPGLGTYTARVLFYRDRYAGIWSAKDHGGQLFGRIVR